VAGDLDEDGGEEVASSPAPDAASERDRGICGDHQRAAGVDGVDDLCVVDALDRIR
jgi:hypothetical protein